jgi:NAD(P)-dependent dehydrogenase (short-subunit alcohol dehydrogenase family)
VVVEAFGWLDDLVHNASYGDVDSIEDSSITDFRAWIESNLSGAVNLANGSRSHSRANNGLVPSSSSLP